MLLIGPQREVRGNLGAPRRELIGSCKRILGELLYTSGLQISS